MNVAARLCDQAGDGQVLVTQRAHAVVEELVEARELGELTLAGFLKPVRAYDVAGVRPAPAPAPARVEPAASAPDAGRSRRASGRWRR